MTPPEAPKVGSSSQGIRPPAVSVCPKGGKMQVLAKRADFLKAARARKQGTSSMLVQARKRHDGEADGIRIGFTCSKKVGNAVARNRAKRRLRAAAAEILPQKGRAGWDYVLIGRAEATAARPYPDLLSDLSRALRKIHEPKR